MKCPLLLPFAFTIVFASFAAEATDPVKLATEAVVRSEKSIRGSVKKGRSRRAPRATKPANWFTLGDVVTFTGKLPDGFIALRGIVYDDEGREVYRSESRNARWVWEDAPVGFYSVAFEWVDDAGERVPAIESLVAKDYDRYTNDPKSRREAVFPRMRQNFCVSPTKPRTVEECPPMFGFNVSPSAIVKHDIPPSAFDLISLLGMNAFIRFHYHRWDLIEKEGRGKYDWREMDAGMAIMKAHGYGMDRLILNAFGTPDWLTSAPPDAKDGYSLRRRQFAPKDVAPHHDFIKAMCERYRPQYVEIWNEPHLPGYSIFWQGSSPQQFVELLKSGYEGAKAADTNIVVLCGGVGMRYYPFWEELMKLRGDRYFDVVDTHCGYNMTLFREIEARYGAEHKPYWEGEWHTVLYNCRGDKPDEETCTYRMLTNMAVLMNEGYERITGFGLRCGRHAPDAAEFYAQAKGIQQISGLFLSLPLVEPRLAAFALRNATDRFKGEIRRRGAYVFREDGQEKLVAFESDIGTMAFAWSSDEKMKPGAFTPEFAACVKECKILDWCGRETSLDKMRPMRVYFVLDPDLAVATARGVKVEHVDFIAYNYVAPDTLKRGFYTNCGATNWVDAESTKGADGLKGAFAVDLTKSELTVKMQANARIENLAFALDILGKGELADVIEFSVKRDGTIIKPRTPALMGDIPPEFSHAGVPLEKTKLTITSVDDEEVWTVRVAMSDLYPFIHSEGRHLRFILSAHTDRGELEWGDGWGRIIKPAQFGVLHVSGGGRTVATQESLKVYPSAKAVTRAGDVASCRANGEEGCAGFTVPSVAVVPGSRLKCTFALKGNNTAVNLAFFAKRSQGGKEQRFNADRAAAGAEWKTFERVIDIPEGVSDGELRIFLWGRGESEFELRDFTVVNE